MQTSKPNHAKRILVLSDIHGNIDALDAVRDAVEFDAAWNLGDVVGYGAAPNESIGTAQQMGSVFVRGNHDKACSGVMLSMSFNPLAAAAARWTMRELSAPNLRWLRELPSGALRPEDDLDAQIVHGSPLDEDGYILRADQAQLCFADCERQITFFGHSHLQGGFGADESICAQIVPEYTQAGTSRLRLREDAKYLINPGSVGQPRDGDRRAAFCIWEPHNETITFHRVDYDVVRAQERIRSAGLPEALAQRLALGR